MLESKADDLCELYATDIGICYIMQSENERENEKEEMLNKAFEWFGKAFNKNQTKATINNYGICFMYGIGTPKDLKKAKEIFSNGVYENDPNSLYHFAYIHEEIDPEKSLFYYKQAADCGNVNAQSKYAHMLFKNGDRIEAMNYYKKTADQGDQKSQIALGFMLESENPIESFNYFKIASDNKNLEATNKLAINSSIENDSEKTYLLMKKLIGSGDFQVPLEYAINLYNSKNYKQAFYYFSSIAKANHPIALYFIALMKFKGTYCNEDKEEAIKIMKDLSEKGIDKASDFLDDYFN